MAWWPDDRRKCFAVLDGLRNVNGGTEGGRWHEGIRNGRWRVHGGSTYVRRCVLFGEMETIVDLDAFWNRDGLVCDVYASRCISCQVDVGLKSRLGGLGQVHRATECSSQGCQFAEWRRFEMPRSPVRLGSGFQNFFVDYESLC